MDFFTLFIKNDRLKSVNLESISKEDSKKSFFRNITVDLFFTAYHEALTCYSEGEKSCLSDLISINMFNHCFVKETRKKGVFRVHNVKLDSLTKKDVKNYKIILEPSYHFKTLIYKVNLALTLIGFEVKQGTSKEKSLLNEEIKTLAISSLIKDKKPDLSLIVRVRTEFYTLKTLYPTQFHSEMDINEFAVLYASLRINNQLTPFCALDDIKTSLDNLSIDIRRLQVITLYRDTKGGHLKRELNKLNNSKPLISLKNQVFNFTIEFQRRYKLVKDCYDILKGIMLLKKDNTAYEKYVKNHNYLFSVYKKHQNNFDLFSKYLPQYKDEIDQIVNDIENYKGGDNV
jgi:hypothetical protein